MSILDKGIDMFVNKVTGKETVRIEPEQLMNMVKEKFISEADEKEFKKLKKMSRGPIIGKEIISKNGRYSFVVGSGDVLGLERTVWVQDLEDKCFYQIYDRKWRKFKKLFIKALNEEIINKRRGN